MGNVPKELVSHKDCHFTVLGVTNAHGEAVLSIVIIEGKHYDITVEMGINPVCKNKVVGSIAEDGECIFDKNNYGKDNVFPGGPVCKYMGKDMHGTF